MQSRPGRQSQGFGPNARLWIVGMVVLFFVSFLLSFAAVRWLPDLITSSNDNASKPTAGSSASTSEAPTTPLEQSDNSRSVTPKPVIPIVIGRESSPNADVSDLPPQTEVSSPLATVVDTVNITSTPQLLDLGEIENAKRIQHRLIDLGFLFGAADGIWGQRSRRGLQEFRAANWRERHLG
jgi:hypothetical protein